MKLLSIVLIALLTGSAWAQKDLTNEMDALGANRELMKKAKAIDPHNKVRVVQNREVSRTNRLEIGLDYGLAMGGDPYVKSDVLGGQIDFHFSPRWSVGARYYDISNTLTSEGKSVLESGRERRANGDTNYRDPGIAYADNEWLAVVNWYPIYGKLSLFESAISQFDVYLLGGAGQIKLDTGTAPVYTAGAGAGVWLTNHITTRLEARWQGYQDEPGKSYGVEGKRDINQVLATATIGILL